MAGLPISCDSVKPRSLLVHVAACLRQVDLFFVCVLILPFLILSYYSEWIITTPFSLDPWYSVGYFLNLEESLRLTSDYYSANRLAYWLPGWLVFYLFPPLMANYVLRLIYFLTATVALYLTVRQLMGRKTALFASFVLSTYWHFQTEVGWNYVDGAGLAYLLLTVCCLTYARNSSRRWVWIAVAGLWFAAAVNTNFFLVAFFPPMGLMHLGLVWIRRTNQAHSQDETAVDSLGGVITLRQSVSAMTRDLTVFVAGGIALTVSLGVYFYHVTGKILLQSSLLYLKAKCDEGTDRSTVGELGCEVPPFTEWIQTSHWLELPIIVLVGSILFLIARHYKLIRPVNPYAHLFQLVYLLVFAIMAFLQYIKMNMLIFSWYAVYMIPFMMLALAGQLTHTVESLRKTGVLLLCVVGVWVSADFFRLVGDPVLRSFAESTQSSYAKAVCLQLLILTALLCVALAGISRHRWYKSIALGSLLVGLAFMNYSRSIIQIGSFEWRKDCYCAITDSVAVLDSHAYGPGDIQFWYDGGAEREVDVAIALHCVYFWAFSEYGKAFPELPTGVDNKVRVPRKPVLVILSRTSGVFEEAKRRLRTIAYDAQFIQEYTISRGSVTFKLTLLRTAPLSSRTPQNLRPNDEPVLSGVTP